MANAYSPVTTWLYVGRNESGGHYIAKKYSGGGVEDVEVMRGLRQVVKGRREG